MLQIFRIHPENRPLLRFRDHLAGKIGGFIEVCKIALYIRLIPIDKTTGLKVPDIVAGLLLDLANGAVINTLALFEMTTGKRNSLQPALPSLGLGSRRGPEPAPCFLSDQSPVLAPPQP